MSSKNNCVVIPSREKMIEHVTQSLGMYLSNNSDKILELPIIAVKNFTISIPLKLIAIRLPVWAFEAGIEGEILVPAEALTSENTDWKNVDWFFAAFLLLESCHERTWEVERRNIHSYAKQLKNWDKRAWDHAWVNRIGIFLSLWNERSFSLQEVRKHYKLDMSHDVDALFKTFQLKAKQGSFNLFNALRKSDNLKELRVDFKKNLNFLLKNSDINNIRSTLEIENRYHLKSVFNISAKLSFRGTKSWFLDPSYKLNFIKQSGISQMILKNECKIGLHGSYNSARQAKLFKAEKKALETLLEMKVTIHRQHWLALYWSRTFQIYEESDVGTDSTLMFNDVSGFRNSACLKWKPWNFEKQQPHSFWESPTLVMDSHIYDYAKNTEIGFERALRIMQEVKFVGGQGQILWHPHTLSIDYGWKEGFIFICDMLRRISTSSKQITLNTSFSQWKVKNECR